MLCTRHNIPTNLITAPTILVIRIHAPPLIRLLPTITCLHRAHNRTNRARPSMTLQITFMRASSWSRSLLPTSLPAAMWGNILLNVRVLQFATPTFINRWSFLAGVLAHRTPPCAFDLAPIPQCTLRELALEALFGPFVDALEMEDGVTSATVPDFGAPCDPANANHTFVLATAQFVVNPGHQVFSFLDCLGLRWFDKRLWSSHSWGYIVQPWRGPAGRISISTL